MTGSTYELPVENIASYLQTAGWTLVSDNKVIYAFEGFQDADGTPLEIILPKNESAPDYSNYVRNSISLHSVLTEKAPETIATEIKLYNHDLLMIDVDARSVNDAAMQIPSIKGLIGYAANSERNLKPFFTQYYSAAKNMLNHFEISQKHNGTVSYCAESQVGEIEPYQRKLFYDRAEPGDKLPLERRVMERIATGLITLDRAAGLRDARPLIDGYWDGFNANMCDAVLKMTAQSPIRYSVRWSKKLPFSQGVNVVKNIQIGRRHAEYLQRASDKLRELKPEPRTVKGLVIGLSSLIDPQSDEDGERSIVIRWDRGGGATPNLRINLGRNEYRKAIKAHEKWATISVNGIAVKRRSGWVLADPHDFKIIN